MADQAVRGAEKILATVRDHYRAQDEAEILGAEESA